MPGIALTLKGQVAIMRRRRVMAVTEGRRATRRPAGRVRLPAVCPWAQQTFSLVPRGQLCGRGKMDQTHPLSSPAFPSFQVLALVSVPLSPCVCQSFRRQVCACVSLSLPPLPPQLSPLLNHLNHGVLVIQSRLSGSSNTPPGDNPESHTRLDASTVTPDPRPLLSRPQTLVWDSAS